MYMYSFVLRSKPSFYTRWQYERQSPPPCYTCCTKERRLLFLPLPSLHLSFLLYSSLLRDKFQDLLLIFSFYIPRTCHEVVCSSKAFFFYFPLVTLQPSCIVVKLSTTSPQSSWHNITTSRCGRCWHFLPHSVICHINSKHRVRFNFRIFLDPLDNTRPVPHQSRGPFVKRLYHIPSI